MAKGLWQRAAKALRRSRKRWHHWQQQLEAVYYRRNVRRSHAALRRRLTVAGDHYDAYLREQLEETLRKKRLFGRVRFDDIPLIDMLASRHDVSGQAVLCVGCRNDDEIRYFRKLGAGRVVGIDLYDSPPDIVTMDMHDLRFADGSFDVVYSRHSFEHAWDKTRAGHEFVRVLAPGGVVVIEVPGKTLGGADRNLFNSTQDVLAAFGEHVGEVFWDEYAPKEQTGDTMDIVRVMFRVRK